MINFPVDTPRENLTKGCYIMVNNNHSFCLAKSLGVHVPIRVIEASPKYISICKKAFPGAIVIDPYFLLNATIGQLCEFTGGAYGFDHSFELMQDFVFSNYLVLSHLYSRTLEHQSRSTIDKDIYFCRIYNVCSFLVKKFNLCLAISMNEPHQVHDFILHSLVSSSSGTCINIMKTFAPDFVVIRDPHRNVTIENKGSLKRRINSVCLSRLINSKQTNNQRYDSRTGSRLSKSSTYPLKNYTVYSLKSLTDELKIFMKSCIKIIFKSTSSVQPFSIVSVLHCIGCTVSDICTKFSIGIQRAFLRLQSGFNYLQYSNLAFNQDNLSSTHYILLPLQCTPERQSMPAGLPCFSQTNLLEEVSRKGSKSDLNVVIKEHPSQHRLYQRNFLGRTKAFFELKSLLPNTTLVPSYLDSYPLIDNSAFVVGIGGSVCWESILRGKNTFVVGTPWYIDVKLPNKFPNDIVSSIRDLMKLSLEFSNHVDIGSNTASIHLWLTNHLFEFDMQVEDIRQTEPNLQNIDLITESVLNYLR